MGTKEFFTGKVKNSRKKQPLSTRKSAVESLVGNCCNALIYWIFYVENLQWLLLDFLH
jgi:hypothetical protein